MKLFIAEDEPPARERLLEALGRVAPGAVVVGQSDSVRGTAQWLAQHPPPDLLLLDIQLADGLSLELFGNATLELPVIFTTAYDRFALEAFQALAVDYLLKPIADAALAQALAKAQRLRAHFGADVARWLAPATTPLTAPVTAPTARPWRQRVFGRALGARAAPLHGASAATSENAPFHALAVTQLACLVSVDKLAVAVALDGSRWQLDQTLAELERELDPARFFRVSRQVLVAAHAVRHYSAAGKGRLKLALRPESEGPLLVSQERAADFKAWLLAAPA